MRNLIIKLEITKITKTNNASSFHKQLGTHHERRNGSSRKLYTFTTMLSLVVELMFGPGNWPLMRMACWGNPSGEIVPYVTFHVK